MLDKACFVCEDDEKEKELLAQKQCPLCKIDLPTAPQRVLEHMAAHILHDSGISISTQPCGLCLQPSPACVFKFQKVNGGKSLIKIDLVNSHCPNLAKFNYAVAAVADASHPCSNVPVQCTLCPSDAPGVWRYNMLEHLKSKHPYVDLNDARDIWEIAESEKKALHMIWKERKTVKKTRKGKNSKSPLMISAAHSSRLTLQ